MHHTKPATAHRTSNRYTVRVENNLTPAPSTKLQSLLDTQTIPSHRLHRPRFLGGRSFRAFRVPTASGSSGINRGVARNTSGAPPSAALLARAKENTGFNLSLATRSPRRFLTVHSPLDTSLSNRPIPKLESIPSHRKQIPRPSSNRPKSGNSSR